MTIINKLLMVCGFALLTIACSNEVPSTEELNAEFEAELHGEEMSNFLDDVYGNVPTAPDIESEIPSVPMPEGDLSEAGPPAAPPIESEDLG